MEEEKELILAIRKDKKFYREEVKENEPNEVKKYKYYENDEELFQQNGEELFTQDNDKKEVNKIKTDEARFSNIIKTELSNLLDSGFQNIILFLGAGASIVMGNNGPDDDYGKTVAMIAKDVNDKLTEMSNQDPSSFYSLEELSDIVNYKGKDIYKDDKKDELKESFNLEDFLSRLIGYIKYADSDIKGKLIKSKIEIFNIIKSDTIYKKNSNNKFGHPGVLKYFSNLLGNDHKLNVITTNYDTVIEDSAEKLKFNVIDGFSFSRNPVFDSSMFEWSFAKNVSNLKTNEIVYKANVINLLKIHGSVTWERKDNSVLRKDYEQVNINKNVMVFPSSDKYEQSYEEPYFELFSKFRELLQIPNTLIFTSGFSFADNHISRIILDALKTNNGLSLVVSDHNINKENNGNIKELYDLMGNNYPVSFLKASMNSDLNKYLGVSDVD